LNTAFISAEATNNNHLGVPPAGTLGSTTPGLPPWSKPSATNTMPFVMLLPASVAPAAGGKSRGRTKTIGTTTAKPTAKGKTSQMPTPTSNNNSYTTFIPVEFSDSNGSVAATDAWLGMAVAGGLTLANPIPTNPYKKANIHFQ
jgi:hypothetical protein